MWIHSVAPCDADGELKDMYDRIGGAHGGVAQIHQAQSLNPKVLATHFELYKALMFMFQRFWQRLGEFMRLLYADPPGC